MMRSGFLLLAVGMVLAGCQRADTADRGLPAGSAATPGPQTNGTLAVAGFSPTNAQPRLQTLKLFIGTETITAEVALTREQVGTGMMFRKHMPENEAMLFVFPFPHRTAFYMKNTTVPLTAAYLDSDGTIVELHDLQPLNETPVEAGTENIQFVLEMNQGWFKRHNVAPGAIITSEHGRLRESFRFGQPQGQP